ncbi:MAG: dockerin type I repeat-containing protein [Oscillospiraceae bacterium]|nr:dockerin type I repeat-containing protein [Oscillospiraceae bacterium]
MKKFLSIFLVFVLVLSLTPAAFAADSKLAGDVNNDFETTTKDITILRRYLAGGYGVEIQEAASDVNGDSAINAKDVTILRRYHVGGYGVELVQPKEELKPDETPRIPLN